MPVAFHTWRSGGLWGGGSRLGGIGDTMVESCQQGLHKGLANLVKIAQGEVAFVELAVGEFVGNGFLNTHAQGVFVDSQRCETTGDSGLGGVGEHYDSRFDGLGIRSGITKVGFAYGVGTL